MAVIAPMRESPAIELRFGSWDKTMHNEVNTRYHSTVVNGLDEQRGPQTIWKNNFMVSPPIRINAVAVPADKYTVGKRASQTPNLSPEKEELTYEYTIYKLTDRR